MIEEILVKFLESETDIPCYLEEPERPPKRYIIIEKTGSSERDGISGAQIAVLSYGGTMYDAASVNALVKSAMRTLADKNNDIVSAKCNSDYNFGDEKTKRYRYQAVFDIVYYDY